jgi:hypothetical protein
VSLTTATNMPNERSMERVAGVSTLQPLTTTRGRSIVVSTCLPVSRVDGSSTTNISWLSVRVHCRPIPNRASTSGKERGKLRT